MNDFIKEMEYVIALDDFTNTLTDDGALSFRKRIDVKGELCNTENLINHSIDSTDSRDEKLNQATKTINFVIDREKIAYSEDKMNERYRNMQDKILKRESPILANLLKSTEFEDGFESSAEKYFKELYKKYGSTANLILQNLYLENRNSNKYVVKHILFIVAELPKERRGNLALIPLAGLANSDIEIQDLSVKCFDNWGESEYIQDLQSKANETSVVWFKKYILDVINRMRAGE